MQLMGTGGAMDEAASLPAFVTEAKGGGWHVQVRVQPGVRKSEFAGVIDGRLRVRLAAPAVENKANRELVSFLAKALGLRPSKVTLLSGEAGRQKRLHVESDFEPDWKKLLSL